MSNFKCVNFKCVKFWLCRTLNVSNFDSVKFQMPNFDCIESQMSNFGCDKSWLSNADCVESQLSNFDCVELRLCQTLTVSNFDCVESHLSNFDCVELGLNLYYGTSIISYNFKRGKEACCCNLTIRNKFIIYEKIFSWLKNSFKNYCTECKIDLLFVILF